MNVTLGQLRAAVMARQGACFVNLITRTKPPCYGVWQDRVVKLARRQGMINANYENCVNNQRIREGHPDPFVVEDLWCGMGQHVGPSIVRHIASRKQYLVFYPTHKLPDGTPVTNPTLWFLDGVQVPHAHVAELLKPTGRPRKQETVKMIPWRTIELKNIVVMTMDGVHYQVVLPVPKIK